MRQVDLCRDNPTICANRARNELKSKLNHITLMDINWFSMFGTINFAVISNDPESIALARALCSKLLGLTYISHAIELGLIKPDNTEQIAAEPEASSEVTPIKNLVAKVELTDLVPYHTDNMNDIALLDNGNQNGLQPEQEVIREDGDLSRNITKD